MYKVHPHKIRLKLPQGGTRNIQLSKKGEAFRRVLQSRSRYHEAPIDSENNHLGSVVYIHATKGYRRRILTHALINKMNGARRG